MKYLRKIFFFLIIIALIFVLVPAICFIVSRGFYFFADLFTTYETFLRRFFGDFSAFMIALVTHFLAAGAIIFTTGHLIDAYFEPDKDDSKPKEI
jgi:hypothetical protein